MKFSFKLISGLGEVKTGGKISSSTFKWFRFLFLFRLRFNNSIFPLKQKHPKRAINSLSWSTQRNRDAWSSRPYIKIMRRQAMNKRHSFIIFQVTNNLLLPQLFWCRKSYLFFVGPRTTLCVRLIGRNVFVSLPFSWSSIFSCLSFRLI